MLPDIGPLVRVLFVFAVIGATAVVFSVGWLFVWLVQHIQVAP